MGMGDCLVRLAERLEAAMSREGKPRGDHMIAAHQAIHDAWKNSDEQEARDLADLAIGNVHAIRAETAMFDALSAVAIEAVAALRSMAASTDFRPPHRDDGSIVVPAPPTGRDET